MKKEINSPNKNFISRIIHIGSERYANTRFYKVYIIQNQVLFISTLSSLLFTLITFFFEIYYYFNGNWTWLYLVPIIANTLLPILFATLFWIKVRTKTLLMNDIIVLAAIFFASIYLLVMTSILGHDGKFYLATFAVMPLPFFLFSATRKWILITTVILPTVILFVGHTNASEEWFKIPLVEAHYLIIEYMVMAITPMILISSCYYIWKQTNIAEDKLEQELDRSDKLLLNILPSDIARELKDNGKILPMHYDSVSVMFTDFVGFTKISEILKPEELIHELDLCFSYFDTVTKRYHLEKIKTIGDSYMLAGGLPIANSTHAIDCVLAALEIQAFMEQMKQIKQAQGFPYWELRLGINTGPLIAGVIGEMKFTYDVFGDTVNTASRMESSGIAGKINISSSTYNLVKDLFSCELRGEVMAKNKGMMEMYIVNSLKPEYFIDGDYKVPNEKFKEKYNRIKIGK
ncbi:MAG: adenylate/guanylate cyclase domain-containing protein [Leptospiraceae bacterium]|nr:adenylate/guanylate cyclase domain-containing protein [Leptospiraceae bacterium]